MKCLNNNKSFNNINKIKNSLSLIAAVCLLVALFTGCAGEEYDIPYGMLESNSDFAVKDSDSQNSLEFFAHDLCATSQDITDTSFINKDSIYAAAMYDLAAKDVMYSYNATTRINPASLTKVMTALIVFENCNLDDTITVQDVTINEEGAQLFKLHEGDKITIRDLLYIDLVYSGNDASLALAKEIAGSEEAFAEMMNAKAAELGCTGTHFVNSNGLTNEDHYTTAYDLYLIFNEAIKYPEFLTIINTANYDVNYTNAEGEFVTKSIMTTNKFLTGDYAGPETLAVIGGKTGTTNAAGKCIIVYLTDSYNNPYICVMMGAADEPTLYQMVSNLCTDVFR